MQAIDQVARLGSIRRAAEAIAISPSALNRQILSVEDDIGAELFERLPRGVRLSTAGEIYLRCFRAHLSELERAASQVADLSGLRAGVVRVGVSEELSNHFAPSALAAFQARHPQVDVIFRVLRMDELRQSINDFEIDVGLAVNWIKDDSIETVYAHEVEVVCIAAATSDLDGQINLSDLADRPLCVPSAGSGLRNAVDAALSYRSIPRRYVLESDRLATDLLRLNPDAAQFAVAMDADGAALDARNLKVLSFPQSMAPIATVSLLTLRYRTLPVAAAKLLRELTRMIAADR